jgi:hypothetical protein
MTDSTTSLLGSASRDHGGLPDWQTGDLPEPLPMTVGNVIRTIGPGAILLAGSIGGGEWIVGPLNAVRYGTGILWIATVGIVLQMVLNLEAIRYTLYSGEPVLTGIMRLKPGSRFWAVSYIVAGFVQLATPAMALTCANVVFTAARGTLPTETRSDADTLVWIGWGVLALTAVLLMSGRSVEAMLEKLSWAMVIFIFGFLLIANFLFVPWELWKRSAIGFVFPRSLPQNVDILLLGVFAATAGSGGLGNLAISNWTRDKGLGMGRWMGSIGGALTSGSDREVRSIGCVFLPTADNLRRWKTWWRYSLLDQSVLWAGGCVIGMYLNVNLALAIVPANQIPSDKTAGAFQAAYMAEHLWYGFWYLALANGFWILFSTQLGNTDVLTRVVTDAGLAGFPRLRKWNSSRLYAVLLTIFMLWGVLIIPRAASAVALFKVLGILASPILAVSAIQILRVNTRFLPEAIRPSLWRRVLLVCVALFYGGIAMASLYDLVRPWLFGASRTAATP